MQKLTGISLGQNNKSCSIIHRESNKISFAFFRLFCDFLRNLQESINHFYCWSSPFARRTLERVWVLQGSPWARWPARVGQFRRARRGTWPEKGWGGSYGALGVDLHRIWGARQYRRASSTAAAGGWRCAPSSGETGTWPRQGTVGLAPGKAREGIGWFARHQRRVERRALLMATGVGHGERGGRTVAKGRSARFL
jgi:hypothetical protein